MKPGSTLYIVLFAWKGFMDSYLLLILMLFSPLIKGITGCQECGISVIGSKEVGLLVFAALCGKVCKLQLFIWNVSSVRSCPLIEPVVILHERMVNLYGILLDTVSWLVI